MCVRKGWPAESHCPRYLFPQISIFVRIFFVSSFGVFFFPLGRNCDREPRRSSPRYDPSAGLGVPSYRGVGDEVTGGFLDGEGESDAEGGGDVHGDSDDSTFTLAGACGGGDDDGHGGGGGDWRKGDDYHGGGGRGCGGGGCQGSGARRSLPPLSPPGRADVPPNPENMNMPPPQYVETHGAGAEGVAGDKK